VVSLGRTPFRDRWRGLTRTDHAIIAVALDHLDLTALGDRHWNTLSGGSGSGPSSPVRSRSDRGSSCSATRPTTSTSATSSNS